MGSNVTVPVIQAVQVPIFLLTFLGLTGVYEPPQADLKNNTSYDYIVVGAGTAGSVIATRLVENSANSVLLLEAGSDPPISAFLAALFVAIPKSVNDWDYRSTFDPYGARALGNYVTLTSGKMLGGTSSLNHFVHTRGCRKDFDDWAASIGDPSLKYENLLPYFIKSERLDDKEILKFNPNEHGTKGPMGLSRQKESALKPYFEALKAVGHPIILDCNAGATPIGYSDAQLMLADGIRQTPGKVYLGRVKSNSNLFVSKNTRVIRILFTGKVATGVVAVYKGQTYVFRARKEIIICAGLIGTPQLLMLSGIGPRDHLMSKGIDVISDLPVGSFYKEQVSTTIIYATDKSLLPIPNPTKLPIVLTRFPFPIFLGSVALDKSKTCADYQTFNVLLAHDTPYLTLVCRNTFWYLPEICDRWQKLVTGRDAFYSLVVKIKPRSNGGVRLKSTNPFEYPAVDVGLLRDKDDLKDLVKYVKDFIRIGQSTYFKKVNAKLIGMDLKECVGKVFGTDEFWECYILNTAMAPYHASSTCPMGEVVDSKFKVYGVGKLRACDSSTLPLPTSSAAPNAIVFAMAERLVDLLLNGQ